MDKKELKTFVELKDLETNRLKEGAVKSVVYADYDDVFDAFYFSIASPDIETAVFYLGDNIGLIYEEHSKEVVGFQIEAFRKTFLPAHDNVSKIWHMKWVSNDEKDSGEIIFKAAKKKHEIVKKVVEESDSFITTEGKLLSNIFENVLEHNPLFVDC